MSLAGDIRPGSGIILNLDKFDYGVPPGYDFADSLEDGMPEQGMMVNFLKKEAMISAQLSEDQA